MTISWTEAGILVLLCVTNFLYGYDSSMLDSVMPILARDSGIEPREIDTVTGFAFVGSIGGGFIGGVLCHFVSLRFILVGSLVLHSIGGFFIITSIYWLVVVGHLGSSVAMGILVLFLPIYSHDVARRISIALISSIPEVAKHSGTVVASVISYAFPDTKSPITWRLMVGISPVTSLLLIVVIIYMPESQLSLIMRGQSFTLGIPRQHPGLLIRTVRKILTNRSLRNMVLVGCIMNFLHHLSLVESVTLYIPLLYQIVYSDGKPLLSLLTTVLIAIIKIIALVFSSPLIIEYRRRPLVIITVIGMGISLYGLGDYIIAMELGSKDDNGILLLCLVISVIMILSLVTLNALGSGPLCWLFNLEVLPPLERYLCSSITVACNQMGSALMPLIFSKISKESKSLGIPVIIFSTLSIGSAFLYILFVPEMKDTTPEQLQAMYHRSIRWSRRIIEEARRSE